MLASATAPPILITVCAGCRRAYDAAWRQAAEIVLLESGFVEFFPPKKRGPVFDAKDFKWGLAPPASFPIKGISSRGV